MKRLFAVILLMGLLLTGCKPAISDVKKPTAPTEIPESTQTEPVEPETETVPEPEILQQPMVAVSLPVAKEFTANDAGENIFYYEYQDVHLTLQDPDVADSVILDLLNRIEQTRPLANDVKEQAMFDNGDPYVTFPYLYEIRYTPKRIDQSLLSFFGTSFRYSGGNHPDHICMAANYSLITGEVLTLGSILTHEDSIAPLCQLVIQELDKIAEDAYLLDDYPQIVSQRFAKEASFDEDWYFTGTGLCFYFAPYEIAGYASGIITAEVPYSLLTGIIDDAYFPPERDTASGSLQATLQSDVSMEQFTQIAEVPLDHGGERVFLYTDGALQDLRIEIGYWNEDATVFTADTTVFATCALTPGDAVVVETYIPDGAPNLRVTYHTDGQEHIAYISQSGEDGSIILI